MKEGIKRRTMRRKERVCLFAFLPSDEGGRAVRGGGRRGGTQPPFWRRKGKISDSTPAPIKQKTKRIKEEKPKSTTRSSTPGREIPDLLIEARAADCKSEPSNPRGFGGGEGGGVAAPPLFLSGVRTSLLRCPPPPKKKPKSPTPSFPIDAPHSSSPFSGLFFPSQHADCGGSIPNPLRPPLWIFWVGGGRTRRGGGLFSLSNFTPEPDEQRRTRKASRTTLITSPSPDRFPSDLGRKR